MRPRSVKVEWNAEGTEQFVVTVVATENRASHGAIECAPPVGPLTRVEDQIQAQSHLDSVRQGQDQEDGDAPVPDPDQAAAASVR